MKEREQLRRVIRSWLRVLQVAVIVSLVFLVAFVIDTRQWLALLVAALPVYLLLMLWRIRQTVAGSSEPNLASIQWQWKMWRSRRRMWRAGRAFSQMATSAERVSRSLAEFTRITAEKKHVCGIDRRDTPSS